MKNDFSSNRKTLFVCNLDFVVIMSAETLAFTLFCKVLLFSLLLDFTCWYLKSNKIRKKISETKVKSSSFIRILLKRLSRPWKIDCSKSLGSSSNTKSLALLLVVIDFPSSSVKCNMSLFMFMSSNSIHWIYQKKLVSTFHNWSLPDEKVRNHFFLLLNNNVSLFTQMV